MLSSANLKLFHMCGHMGLRGGIRGRGGANGLWETRQLILDMGPECREVRTLALEATTSNNGFLHMRALHLNCFTWYNTVHIFLLCRLKINHVKEFHNLPLCLSLLVWLWIVLIMYIKDLCRQLLVPLVTLCMQALWRLVLVWINPMQACHVPVSLLWLNHFYIDQPCADQYGDWTSPEQTIQVTTPVLSCGEQLW